MREVKHFIAGQATRGVATRDGDIYNPSTGQIQATVCLGGEADMQAAVDAAKKVQPEWAATNPQRRARVMFAFKQLLEDNMDKLAAK